MTDRGPTPAATGPSRTAVVVVAALAVAVVVALAVGVITSRPGRTLDEGETLRPAGTHDLEVDPLSVEVTLSGDWVQVERCGRWVQLNAADDDATTLHLVALDAVPDRPAGQGPGQVAMLPGPSSPAAWLDPLDLRLVPTGGDPGRAQVRGEVVATDGSRPADALVACGAAGDLAGIGMRGPAAGFRTHVAWLDTARVPLVVIGAQWTGGDYERAVRAVDEVLDSLRVVSSDGQRT